jgi:hypothetical protein
MFLISLEIMYQKNFFYMIFAIKQNNESLWNISLIEFSEHLFF